MPPSLAARVAALESQMQKLLELPGLVASIDVRVATIKEQFLQFRTDVTAEFSATRDGLREEMRTLGEALRTEIKAGDEETRRYMRVLHEEVISRIKTIGERRASETCRSHRTRRPLRRSRAMLMSATRGLGAALKRRK